MSASDSRLGVVNWRDSCDTRPLGFDKIYTVSLSNYSRAAFVFHLDGGRNFACRNSDSWERN